MNQTQQPLLSIASPASLRPFTGQMRECDELFHSIVSAFQEICDVNYCLLLLLEKEEIKQVYCPIASHLEKQSLVNFSLDIYQKNQAYLEQGEVFFFA